MRTLYILRHAKSDWSDPSLRDFDRPLNNRGRKAAKAMGAEMRRRGVDPDLVLASPAVRARETLRRVEDGYGRTFETAQDGRIYGAHLTILIDVIRDAPGHAGRLMIVGHNEGLQDLVVALARSGELREEAARKFPTAALATLRFDLECWSGVEPGTGELEDLLEPRDL